MSSDQAIDERYEKPATSLTHSVRLNTVVLIPAELQKVLDGLEASRASRKRAWENLQELRWVVKDVTGVDLPQPERKTMT